MEDLISVIALCRQSSFNRELFPSLAQQNYQNFELLVSCVPEEQKELDAYLKGLGLSQAQFCVQEKIDSDSCNELLIRARGVGIMFVESNMVFQTTALKEYIATLKASASPQIIYSSYSYYTYDYHHKIVPFEDHTPGSFDQRKALLRPFFPRFSLFHRQVVDAGIRFKEGIEDYFRNFFTTALAAGAKATYLSKSLVLIPDPEILPVNGISSLRSLADTVSSLPALYPESLTKWAAEFLSSLGNSSYPYSFVFVSPLNAADPEYQKSQLEQLIKFIISQGARCSLLSPRVKGISSDNGVLQLGLFDTSADAILMQLQQLGGEHVLVLDGQFNNLALAFNGVESVVALCGLVDGSENNNALPDLLVLKKHADLLSLHERCRTVIELQKLTQDPGVGNECLNYLEKQASKTVTEREDIKNKLAQLRNIIRSGHSQSASLSISVVICCRNYDLVKLKRGLSSLRDQKGSHDLEIIISDFGSSSEYSETLNQLSSLYPVRIVTTKTSTPWARSIALNIGIQQAKHQWVMTTDADMIFAPEFLNMVSSYLEKIGTQAVYYAQPIKLAPLKLPENWQPNDFELYCSKGRFYGRAGRGGCQIAAKDWLMKVRGFNETYSVWGAEDDDIYTRAGWDGLARIWLEPGYYLHQWHLSNIHQKASDQNKKEFLALLNNPRIVVNPEVWGSNNPKLMENGDSLPSPTSNELEIQEKEIIAKEQMPEEQGQMLLALGCKAIENEQLNAALQIFEDVTFLAPNLAEGFLGLATIYIKLGQFEYATVSIDKALEISPSLEAALNLREWLRER